MTSFKVHYRPSFSLCFLMNHGGCQDITKQKMDEQHIDFLLVGHRTVMLMRQINWS